jgi:FtsP/CotA-like multicopper oxidase with cupredoxin domain
MKTLTLIILIGLQGAPGLVQRLPQNPIVSPSSSPTIVDNINGPSLIRVPPRIEKPLGRYYLYFSHHAGKFIRLAYADTLSGPWKIHEAGTLRIEEAARCHDHVASPDVHINEAGRQILMYFHCPSGGSVDANGRVDINQQETFVAASSDGLRFRSLPTALGPAYFRVFRRGDYYYAIVRGGSVLRSRDIRTPFERSIART